jgi:hypothetical protein
MPSHTRTSVGICFIALGLTSCYLPGEFTEPASPPIVGEYRLANGLPGPGARVAVSSDYDDATCAKASDRATTDVQGKFQLGSTFIVRHGIWLVPAIEHFSNGYSLCVGTMDAMLHFAYAGSIYLNSRERAPSDSLFCQQWIWEGTARVTCSGPRSSPLHTAGTWTDGNARGFYRLITAGDGAYSRKLGVFLQWVEHSDTGAPEIVRATISLPLAPHLLELKEARLWIRPDGSTCLSVHSTGKPLHFFSWDSNHVRVSLMLGPPGDTRPVSRCAVT